MTDSAASPQSKPRAASKKQRQGGVSTETENKLARAARSAQRLAQLSAAERDDSTLDMFPDDPTRATLEAMNIDVRQGTLDGFELPEVVLQAVGALDDGASLDKAARRVPRAVKVDAPAPVNEQLSGFDVEPAVSAAGLAAVDADADAFADTADARVSEPAVNGAMNGAGGETASTVDAAANDKPTSPTRDQAVPLTSAMAAATVARSVIALRQAAEAASAGGKPPQRFAATFAKATMASPETASVATAADAGTPEESTDEASAQTRAASTTSAASAAALPASEFTNARQDNERSAAASASTGTRTPFAMPSREARRAEAAAAAQRAEPELDRARATAFADTVDALYGVIADQRRAATDHTRRMKWMLSIVVGALLVTVAIGIAQTLLLMRLTRETTAQQQRIEQMMQNQQAAMISLLDAHTAMAVSPANAAPAPTATTPAVAAPAAPTPVHGKHAAREPHGHKAKVYGSK
ncbi:hypothetical protein [Paraburkholderia sp. ZP32-5]|uniref:hypothetical protein n=1 Tax=Paraburkholderia sp. ZP32-5 TaxID=2883245 RepID=UPI001F484381|nr:hypothetical protein [Paraburkholderia sp. ZP32-5]